MRSAPGRRLLVVLLVAAAATLVYLGWPDEAARSAPDAPVSVAPARAVPPALREETPAARQPAASALPLAGVPAAHASDGRTVDAADQFAAAMAAAERNGSMNRSAAQAASAQAALDLLDKLMREQARKEPLPVVSPFGEAGPAK